MKRIPYAQLSQELDKLFFGGSLNSDSETRDRAEIIDAFIEACGWTWDEVLEEICNESSSQLQSQTCN